MDKIDIPHGWMLEQSLMSFHDWIDTYYEEGGELETESYEVGGNYLAWSETKRRVVGSKAAKKKARNAYDARMRGTNLYIRFLEDKVKGWVAPPKPTREIGTQTNISNVHIAKILKC